MEDRRLDIVIEPRPKERPQARVVIPKGGKPFAQMYTPAATKKYEETIRKAWMMKHGNIPLEGPLTVRLYFYFGIPKSDTKVKKAAKAGGMMRDSIREDVDNCTKSVLDALNAVAYKDDSQVVTILAKKRYADVPHVVIIISEWKEEKKDATSTK